MFKLLIGLPLLLVAGFVLLGVALPMLALLPLFLAVAGVVLALVVACSVFGSVLRLAAGLVVGAGGLLAAMIGFGFLIAGGVAVLAVGALLFHLLLPLLVIAGLIWLLRRANARTVPQALSAPPAV